MGSQSSALPATQARSQARCPTWLPGCLRSRRAPWTETSQLMSPWVTAPSRLAWQVYPLPELARYLEIIISLGWQPDITAPGVDVIAAYSEEVPATDLSFEVPYNMISGTSMSCPHVAGVAGLIKAKYPGWSPAMIKSAIMTTASTVANDYSQIRDETGGAATPFSYGSGHLNPVPALDPGLVDDTAPFDYANFLKPTQTFSKLRQF